MNLMKKMALVAACMLVSATFVACNDDTAVAADVGETVESSSSEESELSSSSEDSDVVEQSSSSEKSVDDEPSSSSEISSSETVDDGDSSSSSETVEKAESSSSSKKLDCGPIPDDEEFVMTYKVTYDSIVDARDGRVYKTVTFWSLSPEIGPFKCEEFSQTWMAENLNYADSSATPSLLGNNWCYDNDEANCDAEGRLYTWAAAVDSVALAANEEKPLDCGFGSTCNVGSGEKIVRGICPEGWHIPNQSEWGYIRTNTDDVVGPFGKSLKSKTGWDCDACNGTDDFEFTVLPIGMWDWNTSKFKDRGKTAYFWSAQEYFNYSAYAEIFKYNAIVPHWEFIQKSAGLSIRCVKDGEVYRYVEKPSDAFFD